MTKTLKTTALAAFVGLAALVAIPATASAGADIFLEFGERHGPRGGIRLGDEFGERHGPRGGIRLDDEFGDHLRRRPHSDRMIVRSIPRCTVDQAIDKAQYRFGLRRVSVEYANKHVIGVKGRKNGHRREIVFARAPGCPVIDR